MILSTCTGQAQALALVQEPEPEPKEGQLLLQMRHERSYIRSCEASAASGAQSRDAWLDQA